MPSPRVSDHDLWLSASRYHAYALALDGDVTGAIQSFEPIRRGLNLVTQLPLVPTFGAQWLAMREQLAQLYRHAGRMTEADAVETELRRVLAGADADHPIARRLRDRSVLMPPLVPR
jgi:hypothetical protein